jgi:succinoglycan biosynthesis transport protein ExoP
MMPNETQASNAGHGGARDFLAVLFRRRWIIATVFAVTTLTVLAINLTRPLFYESTGKVILKRGEKDTLLGGGLRTMTWDEELASEVETVKSGAIVSRAQAIVDEAHRKAGTKKLSIDPRHVDARVVEKSNVVAMSYESRDPQAAQEVTGALIQAYMAYRTTAYTLQYPKQFFDAELDRVGKELDAWTHKREEYMRATKTVDLGVQGVQDVEFMREQKLELARVDQDLAEKRAALQSMKSLLAGASAPEDLPFLAEGAHGADNSIVELKRNLAEARTRLHSIESIYVPGSAELTQQRAKVENLETSLRAEVANRLRVQQADIANLEARRAEIMRAMGEGQGRLETYPERTARILEYTTRIEALQKNFEDLSRSAGMAKINKATSPEWTVALLTPPSAPYAKNQRDYVRLALAPIFSLIVGLGLAFFLDGLDATLKNPREAESALDLPVLATLNEQKRRRA